MKFKRNIFKFLDSKQITDKEKDSKDSEGSFKTPKHT